MASLFVGMTTVYSRTTVVGSGCLPLALLNMFM